MDHIRSINDVYNKYKHKSKIFCKSFPNRLLFSARTTLISASSLSSDSLLLLLLLLSAMLWAGVLLCNNSCRSMIKEGEGLMTVTPVSRLVVGGGDPASAVVCSARLLGCCCCCCCCSTRGRTRSQSLPAGQCSDSDRRKERLDSKGVRNEPNNNIHHLFDILSGFLHF